MRKLISVFKLSSLVSVSTKADYVPCYNFATTRENRSLGVRPGLTKPSCMAYGDGLGSRGSLLSVYAVQPCGYATLFLHVQKVGFFLMTWLILWKPKINITQACACIMQRSLKAIKISIFRVDSLWVILASPHSMFQRKKRKKCTNACPVNPDVYSSSIKSQSGTPYILTL